MKNLLKIRTKGSSAMHKKISEKGFWEQFAPKLSGVSKKRQTKQTRSFIKKRK